MSFLKRNITLKLSQEKHLVGGKQSVFWEICKWRISETNQND